ncbi:MAG TPA: NADH-quinone oxidoreductase subunit H [Candidatus Lokiarchaeia archaeon]
MAIILKKVIYIILIFAANLYLASFLAGKLNAKMDLARGYVATRASGLSYPFIRIFRFLSKDHKVNFWEFLIFFFSFTIWAVIPLSSNLIIVDLDYNLLAGFLFYVIIIFLNLANASRTEHNYIYSNIAKKTVQILAFFVPVLFCSASIVLVNRALSLGEIINFQYQYWNVIYQPLGFITVFASILLHFKLLGINSKNPVLYSENIDKEVLGFGRLITRISNYAILFFLIVILNIFYLGGWQQLFFINGEIMFALKFYIVFVILILLDKATPRLSSYDYLVSINGRFLLPMSVVNFLITLVFFMLRNIYNLV